MVHCKKDAMSEKANSDLVRRQNRRIVLDALRQQGNLARIELGRATGLSPASITAISAQLIEDDIIQEVDVPIGAALTGKRGRPIVRLSLKAAATHVVAVKISIDDVVMALTDFQGKVLAEQAIRIPTYQSEQAGFGRHLAEALHGFITGQGLGTRDVARIGVAIQGVADNRSGSITWSPAFRARNVPLAPPIIERLGVPVMIANDANMIAEGLLSSDRAHASGITAVIFTGYGVGMGLIINGKVYHGATGAACEFGHMNHLPEGALCRCGRRGCVEAYAADYAILRSADGKSNDVAPLSAIDPTRMTALMARAHQGEAAAIAAYETAGTALGFGIARLIAILNPDRFVLAGPGTRALDLIEPALRRAIADGVVEALSRQVTIEHVAFSTDMIMRGTINALLRAVDHEVFSQGPLEKTG